MFENLEKLKAKYEELNNDLASPEVYSDIKKMTAINKEISSIEDVVNAYKKYLEVSEALEEAEKMMNDPEMGEIAKEEYLINKDKKEELIEEIKILLLPKDERDERNCTVEIRGAAGGDEANIFAGDLLDMYLAYCDEQGFKTEMIHAVPSDNGGFSEVSFNVKGKHAYGKLKYESGAHRVQRIPQTETNGRVHTSTATVLVMPEAEEDDIELDMNDVRVDVYRSSGKGGQGVNTTDSAVRLTHEPTGIVVTCQSERSQIQNKETALKVLKNRLYEEKMMKQEAEESAERKSKIGTGDRSEKIRTYNYPQNSVTDHRIGFTSMNLDRVMQGELSEIIEALITKDNARKMAGNAS